MYPTAPAVRSGKGEVVTYAVMIGRINGIAATLLEAGIKVGSRVAVLQEPTLDWICSIYAIMHVGAVYFPLDLSVPLERLAVIFRDCDPRAIIVDQSTEKYVPALQSREITTVNTSVILSCTRVPPITATANGAAVILYTSGSSGVPKGVILGHRGLINWAEAAAGVDHIGPEIVLQQSSPSFDLSIGQILIAHCFAGSVYLLPRLRRGDALTITEIIASEHISLTMGTPSEHFSWIKYGWEDLLRGSHWKIALCGGEAIVDALMQQVALLRKSDLRFFSTYGPTETTIYSTAMELPYTPDDNASRDHIPSGYILPNSSLYVLDEHLKPVPPGVQGEIYIGGAGVAHGYLNNETLTKEKFVPDIFAAPELTSKSWTTMHRTGDLGRWRTDGAIFIEGRISSDTQIKLRGLRIDLRDIENAIVETAKGALNQAVVSLRQESTQTLVAHVVFDPNYPQGDRKTYLNTISYKLPLPQYMWPAAIIPLDHLPMTTSLKLDRRKIASLPLPEAEGEQGDSVILTAKESQLEALWRETISKEIHCLHKITLETDFFHVGGTSLLLLDLQARIRSNFGVTLPLVSMFESSSLGAMAARIENSLFQIESSTQVSSELLDWEEETNLSPAVLQLEASQNLLQRDPKVVILTGATGFVGHALLKALVEDPSIEKIYCIAVRHAESRKFLLNFRKVEIYQGDLTLPRLGLSVNNANVIFKDADRIIHNGADVSYLKSFQSLRLANLQSTKELVGMSLHHQVPIYYLSTTGIGIFSPDDVFKEVSAAQNPPPADGSFGYAASKWTSERYLEKVNKHCGWPITILRPSSISRQDVLDLDLMQNLLKYSRLMQGVPVFPNIRGGINLVSLESILQSTTQELHREPTGRIRYVHLIGDVSLPLDNIKLFLDEEDGGDVAELPVGEWIKRAESLGLHKILVAFFEKVINIQIVAFPRLLKNL